MTWYGTSIMTITVADRILFPKKRNLANHSLPPSVAAGDSAGVSVVEQAVIAKTRTKAMSNATIFLVM